MKEQLKMEVGYIKQLVRFNKYSSKLEYGFWAVTGRES